MQVVVIAQDEDQPAADELQAQAVASFACNQSILRLNASQAVAENLPPALAETIPHLPALRGGKSFVVLCSGNTCQPPVFQPAELQTALRQAMRIS